MTVTGINPKYAIIKENAQQFPAVQATNYKPRTLNEEIGFCLSEDSYKLIETSKPLFNSEIVECVYGRESVLMHKIITPVRWVFLTIPKIFLMDKNTKEVNYLEKGVRLAGTGKVTIARCFLACLVGENLILDSEGKPQIFTLKLTSSKTQLIGYGNTNPEVKTLVAFNNALQKKYTVKGSLLHLASLSLKASPKEFSSRESGASSLGVMFEIDGGGRSLSEAQQEQVFEFISTEEVQEVFNDPFRLNSSKTESQDVVVANSVPTNVNKNRPISRPVPTNVPVASVVPKSTPETSSPEVNPDSFLEDLEVEENAWAWALEELPELTMHKLRQEWEYLKPKQFVNSQGIERESKALAWVERIEDLKVVPF